MDTLATEERFNNIYVLYNLVVLPIAIGVASIKVINSEYRTALVVERVLGWVVELIVVFEE
jgi:hypothetical protein